MQRGISGRAAERSSEKRVAIAKHYRLLLDVLQVLHAHVAFRSRVQLLCPACQWFAGVVCHTKEATALVTGTARLGPLDNDSAVYNHTNMRCDTAGRTRCDRRKCRRLDRGGGAALISDLDSDVATAGAAARAAAAAAAVSILLTASEGIMYGAGVVAAVRIVLRATLLLFLCARQCEQLKCQFELLVLFVCISTLIHVCVGISMSISFFLALCQYFFLGISPSSTSRSTCMSVWHTRIKFA
jgi:hypothetical protein